MPRTKLVRASGGDGGGKAADRREGERRCMPRAQNRNRHVAEAVNLRIGGVQNRDHVRPSIGARCGKAARRDLCGGTGVTRFPTATKGMDLAGGYPDLQEAADLADGPQPRGSLAASQLRAEHQTACDLGRPGKAALLAQPALEDRDLRLVRMGFMFRLVEPSQEAQPFNSATDEARSRLG